MLEMSVIVFVCVMVMVMVMVNLYWHQVLIKYLYTGRLFVSGSDMASDTASDSASYVWFFHR